MASARRMSLSELERLTNLLPESVSMLRVDTAKLVLVDGLSMQEAADKQGLNNRQAVYDAVKMVWDLHLKLQRYVDHEAAEAQAVPPGWVSTRLILPEALLRPIADEVEAFVATSKAVPGIRKVKALNDERIAAARRQTRRVTA